MNTEEKLIEILRQNLSIGRTSSMILGIHASARIIADEMEKKDNEIEQLRNRLSESWAKYT